MNASLPQKMFVYMEDDGDGDYFPVPDNTHSSTPDGTEVGVYELVDTKTLRRVTTTELV